MNTQRKEQKFEHAVIGILASGEILTLDRVFDDGELKGATGGVFVHVSQGEIDQRNTTEYCIERWESGTGETMTEEQAENYMRWGMDGEFPFHDNSYCGFYPAIMAKVGLEEGTLECVGVGRCFSRGMVFAKIINQELLDLALSFEAERSPKTKLHLGRG